MPKTKGKAVFVCDSCGNEHVKWEGKCPSCGAWATLAEVQLEPRNGHRPATTWTARSANTPLELADVSTEELPRLALSSAEDRLAFGFWHNFLTS